MAKAKVTAIWSAEWAATEDVEQSLARLFKQEPEVRLRSAIWVALECMHRTGLLRMSRGRRHSVAAVIEHAIEVYKACTRGGGKI